MKPPILRIIVAFLAAIAAASSGHSILIDDATFFGKLNLTQNGPLESVRVALGGENGTNFTAGRQALIAHYRARTSPLPVGIAPLASDVSSELAHSFTFVKDQTYDLDGTNPNDGDPDWNSVPDEFDTSWYANLVRFGWVESVIANYLAATNPDPTHIENMVDVIADYINDVVVPSTSFKADDGGELQCSIRMAQWTRQLFAFIQVQHPNSNYVATDDQLIDMLKHIWAMADYTTNNNLGFVSNRGMLQARDLRQVAISFPEFDDAAYWLEKTQEWAGYYFPANIHSNGVLGEATTHYHAGQIEAIDEVLSFDRLNAGQNLIPITSDPYGYLSRMLTYWMDITQPNLDLFLVGDSSSDAREANIANIAVTHPLERHDVQYVATQGATGVVPAHTSIWHRQGAVVMRNGWSSTATAAFIENQPGSSHSHPDNLAFSLYSKGAEMISNSGRLSYEGSNLIGQWHDSETEANSTIEIDERPMLPFGERINRWTTQVAFDFADGQYSDGINKILLPEADTFVRAGTELVANGTITRTLFDRNFSKEPALAIRNRLLTQYTDQNNPNEERIAYLRFRPGMILETISSVSLQLYLNTTVTSTSLALYGVPRPAGTPPDVGWDESSLTWETGTDTHHPNNDAVLTGQNLVSLGNITVQNAGWVTIDASNNSVVAAALRSFIADQTATSTGTGYITLAICEPAATNRIINFSSKEGLNPPRLEIKVGSSNSWADTITHRRKVYFDRSNDLFIISDLLSGNLRRHRFKQMWSLGTVLTPSLSGNSLSATTSSGGLRIVAPSDGNLSTALADGWISKSRDKLPNKRLEFLKESSSSNPSTPIVFETVIGTKSGSAPGISVLRRTVKNVGGNDVAAAVATGLKVTLADASDILYYFTAHEHDGSLRRFDNYATDGDLAVVRTSNATSPTLERIDVRNATYVQEIPSSGTPINLVASSALMPDLSVNWNANGTVTMFSSRPLSQDITIYSSATLTAVTFNGEVFVPTSDPNQPNFYTIARKLLYSTGFENGVASGWTFGGTNGNNNWAVDHINGNRVLAHAPTTGNSYATVGNTSGWAGDTVIRASIQAAMLDESAGYVGLMARYSSASSYYYFIYDNSDLKLKIMKKHAGATSSLVSAAFVMPLDSPHQFQVTLKNVDSDLSDGDVTKDDVSIKFRVSDTEIETIDVNGLGNGGAGVIERKSKVWFDDFHVAGATSLSPYIPATANRRILPAYHNSYISDREPASNTFNHFHIEHNARLPVLSNPTPNSGNRISYIKFRLADLAMASASKATLRLYGWAKDYETATSAVTVQIQTVSSQTWNDRQITWLEAPAGAATSTTKDILDPQFYDVDVTSYVNYALGGSSEFITFRLVDPNNANREVNFFSNVYAAAPQLVVEDTTQTP